MSLSLWNGDLHLHTNLSFCAPQDTLPESYLPFCEQEDIRILGFSNHLYATHHFPEAPENTRPGMERLLQIRPQLEELKKQTDVKILLGCEVETVYGKEPTLRPEESAQFDYILLAASHVMNIPGEYIGVDLSTPDKLRKMILNRFFYACSLEYQAPVGICHPLYALCTPWEQEVIDGISDAQLKECFSAAAEKGISIEVHACLYRGGTRLNEEGLSPSYLRMLSVAKACGCKFHFGSDAHAPGSFSGVHDKLRKAASDLGITEADMWKLPTLE